MPLTPETPQQNEQSYVNYLKYKQEEPDNAPWIFSWLLMAASGCFIGIVLSFGFAWLCGWIP
jgi:hypothetical protein